MEENPDYDWRSDYMLLGTDVVSLFPSLSAEKTGWAVRKQAEKSDIQWEDIGFDWLIGYSKKLKFWSWTLVTQGIFVMTLLDNLSQKFAQKKYIFPSLIAKSFYKGI